MFFELDISDLRSKAHWRSSLILALCLFLSRPHRHSTRRLFTRLCRNACHLASVFVLSNFFGLTKAVLAVIFEIPRLRAGALLEHPRFAHNDRGGLLSTASTIAWASSIGSQTFSSRVVFFSNALSKCFRGFSPLFHLFRLRLLYSGSVFSLRKDLDMNSEQ